jgi:6-phosphogluconolactonase (cycloisomerase 2 family)
MKEARKMRFGTADGRRSIAPVLLIALLTLAGCDGFFVKEPSGGGGTTGNYVYTANSSTNSIGGFSISKNALSTISGLPLSVGYSPGALAVTPSNSFLYVAGPGAIYAYAINSNGTLTASSSGAAVAIVNVSSIAISPDGQWLFGLDLTTTVLDQFQINASTGALTSVASTPYSVANAVVSPRMVTVAPTGNFIFAALGTGGDIVFTLNTSTGAVATSQQLSTGSTTASDNALAVDSTTAHLYIARSGTNGGLAVFTIGASGTLTSVTGSPFAAGNQPFSVLVDGSGKYVYVANRQDGTIGGYTIGTTGALTAISGSPFASGTLVTSLAEENTSTYVLAGANGGSPDLSMYSFDATTPGKLDLATSAATGTDPTGVVSIATTH